MPATKLSLYYDRDTYPEHGYAFERITVYEGVRSRTIESAIRSAPSDYTAADVATRAIARYESVCGSVASLVETVDCARVLLSWQHTADGYCRARITLSEQYGALHRDYALFARMDARMKRAHPSAYDRYATPTPLLTVLERCRAQRFHSIRHADGAWLDVVYRPGYVPVEYSLA
jgi:hypothetical protein